MPGSFGQDQDVKGLQELGVMLTETTAKAIQKSVGVLAVQTGECFVQTLAHDFRTPAPCHTAPRSQPRRT